MLKSNLIFRERVYNTKFVKVKLLIAKACKMPSSEKSYFIILQGVQYDRFFYCAVEMHILM